MIDERTLHDGLFGSPLMTAFTHYLIARGTISRLITVTLQTGHVDDVSALIELYIAKHPDRVPDLHTSAASSPTAMQMLRAYVSAHSDIDKSVLSLCTQ